MPYIPQADRPALGGYDTIALPKSPDELKYALMRVINRFLGETPRTEHLVPDISQADRLALSDYDTIAVPRSSGELNYALTRIINRFLGEAPHYEDYNAVMGVLARIHYEDYNAVMGVLASMGHEIYRRRIAPCEDEKIDENGDVF